MQNSCFLSLFEYDQEMTSLEKFIDGQLQRGLSHFSSEEAMAALDLKPHTLKTSIARLIKKHRLANPRHGFFLILRPEDRLAGAPDPAHWIDPLMKYQELDYRISLLRAAAFHGIELTLLDCARYFHKATGINGIAQIAKDVGGKANPRKLAEIAATYESSSVRRLGYLLEHCGHTRQANALEPFAQKAKTPAALEPAAKSLIKLLGASEPLEKNTRWKILVNEPVEIDF